MEIIWHGHSCVTLKGKDATLVLDAFDRDGLQVGKADVALFANLKGDAHHKRVKFPAETKILDWPGESEVSGISIEIFEFEDGEGSVLIPYMVFEDIRIVTLSSLGSVLSDEIAGKLGDVDVLLVPVEGQGVLDAKSAQKMVEVIEPRIVIPTSFDGAPVEFLKLMGKANVEPKTSMVINGRSALPEDTMEIVLLEAQS